LNDEKTPKHRIALFSAQQLTAIAKILGETASGLTGTQIGQLIDSSEMDDVSPDVANWQRSSISIFRPVRRYGFGGVPTFDRSEVKRQLSR
jgi:hypothetical protein